MSNLELAKELGVPIFNESRRYWLVRANSGIYFDDFIFDNYIGIGWNKINTTQQLSSDTDKLKEDISSHYPDEQAGRIAGQLKRFSNEIKCNDIVMIPNKDSRVIAFCEVLSDDIYIEDLPLDESSFDESSDLFYETEDGENVCPFIKRKKINLLKIVKRKDLDPYLFRVLSSHHTISNADNYSMFIDRTLSDIFVKGDSAHIVFHITKSTEIPAIDLIEGINNILSLLDIYNATTDEPFNKKLVDMKLNVQSPGTVELFTQNISNGINALLFAGAFATVFAGSKGDTSFKAFGLDFKHKFETEGLFSAIRKFKEVEHPEKNMTEIEENIDTETLNKLESEIEKLKNSMETLRANTPGDSKYSTDNDDE